MATQNPELQAWHNLIKSLPTVPSKRVITLNDIVGYVDWHYKANIVPKGTPQHIIQRPALQAFVEWLLWADDAVNGLELKDLEATTEILQSAQVNREDI